MHSCVYVIIGKTGDIETEVARAMQPFDETLQVKPYKLHLSASSVAAMAACYKLPQTDLQALAAKLKDWIGSSGGIDQFGLYALLSHNPDGEFDWYEIGGRYHGWIRGRRQPKPHAKAPDAAANTLPAAAMLRAKDFVKRLPFAMVCAKNRFRHGLGASAPSCGRSPTTASSASTPIRERQPPHTIYFHSLSSHDT
jgi:hypothetical protein